MADMPVWQILLMHLPTMLASVAGLVAACAAWRSAARSGQTSQRNEGALGVVHNLLNGAVDELRRELAQARTEIADLRASKSADVAARKGV